MFIRFFERGEFERVIEATYEEWEALIAPALARGVTIDSATVDPALRDALLSRPEVPSSGNCGHEVELV